MSGTATLQTTTKTGSPMKSDVVLTAIAQKESVESRLATERTALDACNAAVSAAEKALTDSVRLVADGSASTDPGKILAVAEAIALRDFQLRLVNELARRADEAQAKHIRAIGLAHIPLYQKGLAMRLKAAQDADTARAALFRAEGAHRTGTSMIQRARQHGAPDPHGDVRNMIAGNMKTGLVATEELHADHTASHERAIWQGAHDSVADGEGDK